MVVFGTEKEKVPPEFREQLIALVRAGRSPEVGGSEPSGQTIRNWVAQASRPRYTEGWTHKRRAGGAEFGRRTSSSSLNGRYCQKPRPGSHRRLHAAYRCVTRPSRCARCVAYCGSPRVDSMRGSQESRRGTHCRMRLGVEIELYHARSDVRSTSDLDLREESKVSVAKKRVARLMREKGLVDRRRSRKTTVRSTDGEVSADLVKRNFSATAPNQLWVADITYVRGADFCFWRSCSMFSAGGS